MKKFILCIAALSFMTGAYAQDNKLTPGPGEVELIYVGKNIQLGVWNPETRVYTVPAKYKDGPKAGQYRTLTFTDDGKVVNGDGKEVGSKQPNGSWKSPKIENVMLASYNVIWNNEIVGNIMQTIVSIHGLPMVQTSAPMDQDVLTFLVFCNHWGGDQINKIKEEVKKDDERKAAEARERAAKNPKNTVSTENTQKEAKKYSISNRGHSTVGFVDENGVVYDSYNFVIGQLPKGSGNILDKNGNSIGSISGNKIYTRSSGLEGEVENSNIRVRVNITNEVVARIGLSEIVGTRDFQKLNGFERLGGCDYNDNKLWMAALVYFDAFGLMK